MDLIRLLIDKIEELAKDIVIIHSKMVIEPIANPSTNIKIYSSSKIFFRLELGQELDDKTADIKKLAYDVSTKLKSIPKYIIHLF
jgi:hypothetical protein